jgi:sulfur-oxidizing protein SoxB
MPISWVVTIAKQPGKFISRLDLTVGKGDIDGSRFKLIPLFADAVRPDAMRAKQGWVDGLPR